MRWNAATGRVRRVDVGGEIYPVRNRANFRSRLFREPAHYQAFIEMVEGSLTRVPMRNLAYCLMPTPEPPDYRKWLNHSQGREEIANIRDAIRRSRPYGSEPWVSKTVGKFGLEMTTRNPGRPSKST